MANGPATLLIQSIRGLADAPGAGELSDRELVERFADRGDRPRSPSGSQSDGRGAGDQAEEAFVVLVRRHGAMVLGVCRRLLGHEQDAEDVFQAVFLVLSRKAAALRRKEAVGPWLFGVAHRLALRARLAARKRQDKEARADQPGRGDDPADELTVREARAVLDEELARLPERDRGPLVLCYLEGLTRDEAARRLGCPLGTLKARLERARAVLQKRLARRGLGLSAVLATLLLTKSAASGVTPALQAAAVEAATGGALSPNAAALADAALKSAFGKWKLALVLAAAATFVGAALVAGAARPDSAVAQVTEPDKPKPAATPAANELRGVAKPVAVQPSSSPPRTPRRFLDLQPHANQKLNEDFHPLQKGNNLANLPAGEQTLAGVKFRVGEGLIQLRGRGAQHPEKVTGIAVGEKFSRLYALHAAQWDAEKPDTQVGYYTVHYEDDTRETIPLVFGKDVSNWWLTCKESGRAEVAWTGTNENARTASNTTIRLYVTRWQNPRPDRTVTGIDFASANTEVAPFCVAITVEE
jgi:RNA polymerase sigma factor (sigma-70 family)